MRNKFFILVLASVIWAQDLNEKEYIVDLNAPAGTRYNEIIRDNAPLLKQMVKSIKENFPKDIQSILIRVFNTITKEKYKEYTEEITGMAKVLGVAPQDIFISNCIFELITMCTSIVAQDPNNKVVLARNFDLKFTKALRKLHYTIIYKKNNKELFRCGNIAGYTGVFTCMKPNAFSLSLNARRLNNKQEMIKQFLDGKPLTGWVRNQKSI